MQRGRAPIASRYFGDLAFGAGKPVAANGFCGVPEAAKSKSPSQGRRALRLAQRMGFEPMVPLRGTHDFQSCSFDRSDISAKNLRHYNIEFQEKQAISERTGKIFQDGTILSSCFSVGKEFDEK